MISNISQLRNVPKPSADVVTKAMDLLAAFGAGDKTMKKTLKEMHDIQVHNEAVSVEARKTLDSMAMLKIDLKKREDALQYDIKSHDVEHNKIREELEMLKNRAELRIKTNEEAVISKNEDLNSKLAECEEESQLNKALKFELTTDQNYLNVQLVKLKEDREICDKESQELAKTRESLKNILSMK